MSTRRNVLPLLGLVTVAAPLAAVDPPRPDLRPGLWRLERTFETAPGGRTAQPIEAERCFDPAKDFDAQVAMFRSLGCAVESRHPAADIWETSVRCTRQGMSGTSTGRMVVASREAYTSTIENTGELAAMGARERLTARRVGNCPPGTPEKR